MTRIITVPAFSDNYIWLLCNEDNSQAAIVDPGDAAPVIKALEAEGIKPVAILITHFHHDHVGGIAKLLEVYPGLRVYGPEKERIPHMTHPLNGTETINLDRLGIRLDVMDVPGHTAGHIAYYDEQQGNLFCGDTLFACGCGRVFDGTLQDLHDSLQKIARLPAHTQIYCAHEYTLDNIGFAKWVEPDNVDLIKREQADMALIDNDKATVPSLLSLELKTNPFLRTDKPNVIKRVEEATGKSLNDGADVFAAMRTWKDTKYD
jgi:hydroxyacylglutathione hydrolase